MFSSILSLYPLDASSIAPAMTTKSASKLFRLRLTVLNLYLLHGLCANQLSMWVLASDRPGLIGCIFTYYLYSFGQVTEAMCHFA